MTEPAHVDEWTAAPTLNTDAVVIIGEADRLQQRERKPVHTVPVLDRLDDSMRNRINEWFNTHA